MVDIYVQNPELLNGKPKETIGDLVDENRLTLDSGEKIWVPRRYKSGLEEALSYGRSFINRGELTQDHNGCSNLLDSIIIPDAEILDYMRKAELDERGFFKDINSLRKLGIQNKMQRILEKILPDFTEENIKEQIIQGGVLDSFCKIQNLDYKEISSQVSFSFWEHILGKNGTIIRDDSIRDRYHIFFDNSYAIVDKDQIRSKKEFSKDLAKKLIDFYNKIRMLENFDKNHCPLIEFQYNNDRIYFLQYHRTRDFSESTFKLGKKKKDEFEAHFVRGHTKDKHGETFKYQITYHKNCMRHGGTEYAPLVKTEGFYNYAASLLLPIVHEIQARERKVNIIVQNKKYLPAISSHGARSGMFKPQIGVVFDTPFFTNEQLNKMDKQAYKDQKDIYVDMHIRADGNKAFLRIL